MNKKSPPTADSNDWLDYGVYAESLWTRMATALARADPERHPHGGDPIVVGIFGEWGSGKSKLLEMVYDLAALQSARDCADRALGHTSVSLENQAPVTLTVPVWFHPWKYEHEPFLAIPLLVHIADSLVEALASAKTLSERTIQLYETLEKQGKVAVKRVTDVIEGVERQRAAFERGVEVAGAIASNELVRTIVGVAAGTVGLSSLAQTTLDRIVSAADLVAQSDGVTESSSKPPATDSSKPDARTRLEPPPLTVDGRFYYNLSRYLTQVTRIRRGTTLADGSGNQLTLQFAVHINFVVCIDDLDRCLPEKAVELLEVIKTMLNVDSFAFAVALDDEVIERGISHRYRDYKLAGKKPEMPITGFEYLEKIVHLPFRLPQLTRRQAIQFLERVESVLVSSPADRLLFPGGARSMQGTNTLSVPANDATNAEPEIAGRLSASRTERHDLLATNLRDLVLGSLDSYIPRKLHRIVEVWTQMAKLVELRGLRLGDGTAPGQLDSRVLMAICILQLFQPEIFRQLRRAPATFPSLLDAFGRNELRSTTPSSVDLYMWAAFQATPVGESPTRAVGVARSMPTNDEDWRRLISELPVEQRFSAEQVRLPVADLLSEHRLTRRHALNPTALIELLATQLAATQERSIVMSPYLSLLDDAEIFTHISGGVAGGRQAAQAIAAVVRREVTAKDLFLPFVSDDAADQSNLLATYSLSTNEILSREAIHQLGALISDWLRSRSEEMPSGEPTDRLGLHERVLRGVAALAHHAHPPDLAASDLWRPAMVAWQYADALRDPKPVPQTGSALPDHRTRALLRISHLLVPLVRLGYEEWMSLDGSSVTERARAFLVDALGRTELGTGMRAEAGDALGGLGDPRFDRSRFHLPVSRIDGTRFWDPDRGFAIISAGRFSFGRDDGSLTLDVPYDFWISRYPATVDQYGDFVAAGGYGLSGRQYWASTDQGWKWRTGKINSSLGGAEEEWMLQRSFGDGDRDMRRFPWEWPMQELIGNRPVTGVNWFEASAYCVWLTQALREDPDLQQLDSVRALLSGYVVRLPTEAEWEKAARHTKKRAAPRKYPWGESDGDIHERANVDGTIGHPTAVRSYPKGLSGIGLADISGNVWEWTGTEVAAESPNTLIGARPLRFHKDLSSTETPVLRGGSWIDPIDKATCDSRFAARPDDYGDNVGFRWVIAPRQI